MDKKQLAYAYAIGAVLLLMVAVLATVKDLYTGLIIIALGIGAVCLFAGFYKKISAKKFVIILIILMVIFAIIVIPMMNFGEKKCVICGEPATQTFQGDPYCDKHAIDAASWALAEEDEDNEND